MVNVPLFGLRETRNYAGLAQMEEHLICNQGVTGSNPVTGTNFPNVSEPHFLWSVVFLFEVMLKKYRTILFGEQPRW